MAVIDELPVSFCLGEALVCDPVGEVDGAGFVVKWVIGGLWGCWVGLLGWHGCDSLYYMVFFGRCWCQLQEMIDCVQDGGGDLMAA